MRLTARRETALSLGCYSVAVLATGAGMWLAATPLPGSASLVLLGVTRLSTCQACAHSGAPVVRLAELGR